MSKPSKFIKPVSVIAAIFFCLPLALAAQAQPISESAAPPSSDGEQCADPAEGGRRGPPPEAIEACEGAQEGDSCNFEGRDGEALSGTCGGPPDAEDKPLACRPDFG